MRVPYCDRSVRLSVRACVCACGHPVRKKWLSPFYSIPRCDKYTKLAPTIHLDMYMIFWYHVVVCVLGLRTCHAWVTMVRKKWLSLYYSPYWCYIHQTCTICSSWHDLLIPCVGLCPWPSFQVKINLAVSYSGKN